MKGFDYYQTLAQISNFCASARTACGAVARAQRNCW